MVETLREKKPKLRFVLELITRDPLKVPCMTADYWKTMPMVAGKDLARTLRFVRKNRSEAMLKVKGLPLKEQVALEENNVKQSIQYARKHLQL